MKAILSYIRQYVSAANMPVHLISILFLAVLVFANYSLGINQWLQRLPQPLEFISWYLLLLFSFCFPYLLYHYLSPKQIETPKVFLALMILAPFVFAWKMAAPSLRLTSGHYAMYWNTVLYFPFKGMVVTMMLFMLRMLGGKDAPMMGLRAPATSLMPYMIMLALMVPLVLAAATQPDFLQVYPKFQHLQRAYPQLSSLRISLFELSYGSDFFTIELFFRGFLVIYLSRWAGERSILPMAVLYCVIHFGKPLGECISSFFGGMLLGIVSYRTDSIWGGLVVHLGIAWLMEVAGVFPLSP